MNMSRTLFLQNINQVFGKYLISSEPNLHASMAEVMEDGDKGGFQRFMTTRFDEGAAPSFKACLPQLFEYITRPDQVELESPMNAVFQKLSDYKLLDWPLEEQEAVLGGIEGWMLDLHEDENHDAVLLIHAVVSQFPDLAEELLGEDELDQPHWMVEFFLKKDLVYLLLRSLVPMSVKQSEIEVNLEESAVLNWHDMDSLKAFFQGLGEAFSWHYGFESLNLGSLVLVECLTQMSCYEGEVELRLFAFKEKNPGLNLEDLEDAVKSLDDIVSRESIVIEERKGRD